MRDLVGWALPTIRPQTLVRTRKKTWWAMPTLRKAATILVLCAVTTISLSAGLNESAECVVKIYGAGGVGRLEGFGSGVLVSRDGWIVTVYGPMLETDSVRVVLSDGRRLPAKVVGVDVPRELAALKVDAVDLPAFDLASPSAALPGDAIWAFSNLYNIATGAEAVSVQRGIVSAVSALAARKGIVELSYPGEVYILDAVTNNPGASGGAVVDSSGRLVGIIGKDVRSALTNTWINFAIPVKDVAEFVAAAKAGKAQVVAAKRPAEDVDRHELAETDLRGILTLPEILDRTPAFVDDVEPGSPAEAAGLQPDDLVVFIGETLIQSVQDLRTTLRAIPVDQDAPLVILRGETLHRLQLRPRK